MGWNMLEYTSYVFPFLPISYCFVLFVSLIFPAFFHLSRFYWFISYIFLSQLFLWFSRINFFLPFVDLFLLPSLTSVLTWLVIKNSEFYRLTFNFNFRSSTLIASIQNTVVQWIELQGYRSGSHRRPPNIRGLWICGPPRWRPVNMWGAHSIPLWGRNESCGSSIFCDWNRYNTTRLDTLQGNFFLSVT